MTALHVEAQASVSAIGMISVHVYGYQARPGQGLGAHLPREDAEEAPHATGLELCIDHDPEPALVGRPTEL